MQKVSFVEFRKHLSEYIGKARFANTRTAVTYHEKVVGGFVSAEDLRKLEKLEQEKDLQAFDEGMESIKKNGSISLKDFKKGIGLG